ncbi:tetratricopeptide repeat protein [[Clostridium] innocuum]|nr:tetratricopeptide repeat protein [[Clostridium] innocuum]
MNVSRDRLSVIGKLIGIYREERRNNTQNGFTLKKFCEGICSINTLKSIEAGGLSRSEDVYIELLGKLDLKFGEFPVIDEALNIAFSKLYEAIEFYDRDKINALTVKMINILNEVSDFVYYSELTLIAESIHMYYINDEYVEHNIANRLIVMLPVLGDMYSDFIKILVFSKMKCESVCDKLKYKKLIDDLDLQNCNHNFMKINLLHYYYVSGQYVHMLSLIDELEAIFIHEKNDIRLLDTYNYVVILLSDIDRKTEYVYLSKIKELIKKKHYPNVKIGETHSNLGTAYYLMEDYEKALYHYQKMLEFYDEFFIMNYIYMADCQNRLNRKINIPRLSDTNLRKSPINLRVMYKYFTLPDTVPAFVKQNYIFKKVLPFLYDEEVIDIFRYEVSRLIELTSQYKQLHVFDMKIRENKANIS